MNAQKTSSLHTGNTIPLFGLGTWQLLDDTAGTIEEALRMGYVMIDTSGDYGTQPGIADGVERSGVARDKVYIVTKIEEDEDAYEATKKNLDELRMTYADLLLIHRPPKRGVGILQWEGLIRARQDGLTKDIGVSNYAPEQINALIEATGEVPVVNQIEWSPFGHSEEMMQFADELGMRIQAYSPLTRTKRLDDETLGRIAAVYGKSPAQILIKWSIQRGTIPIPKANQRKHLQQNIAIFDFEISGSDMTTLNTLNEHYSSLGSLPYL